MYAAKFKHALIHTNLLILLIYTEHLPARGGGSGAAVVASRRVGPRQQPRPLYPLLQHPEHRMRRISRHHVPCIRHHNVR